MRSISNETSEDEKEKRKETIETEVLKTTVFIQKRVDMRERHRENGRIGIEITVEHHGFRFFFLMEFFLVVFHSCHNAIQHFCIHI